MAGFLYPDINKIFSASSFRAPMKEEDFEPEYDLNFAAGKVVEITAEGLILETGRQLRAVRVLSDTLIWKEVYFTPNDIEIQIGDRMDARGTALMDGSLQAKRAWINIARLDGTITSKATDHLIITTPQGRSRKVEFSPWGLDIISAIDQAPLPNHLESLEPGSFIGAVGVRPPKDDFRATRIWLWESK